MNKYTKKDFFFDLPEDRIAQQPITPRNHSKMLVMDRKTGKMTDKYFYDLKEFLNPGDCLILNNSRVLPARIYGTRVDTGSVVEFLLLHSVEKDMWEALAGPGKKAKEGQEFKFGNGLLFAKVIKVKEDGNRILKFRYDSGENFYNILERIGEMPLPHYITAKLEDKERYQTVYSKDLGSVAAPTAGLHFTKEQLADIKKLGIKIGYVTLHVGLGTFRPVKTDNILDHKMHSEHFEILKETADIINNTKENGGRVIAVGTTSCRTLESVYVNAEGRVDASEGWTDIFIYPGKDDEAGGEGYDFKVIDGLLTNFHLPESTLIMLVSAFAGYKNTMRAYNYAVDQKYRFYSFGDAMLII